MSLLSHSFFKSLDKITEENIKFESNGVNLKETICFPEKPFVSIFFVSGSGLQKRNSSIAKEFVNQGIAAFLFDKRGVGKSEVKYVSNISAIGLNLKLLAMNSKSAINLIVKVSRFENISLGATGISQAGWIIPIAAVKNELIDFSRSVMIGLEPLKYPKDVKLYFQDNFFTKVSYVASLIDQKGVSFQNISSLLKYFNEVNQRIYSIEFNPL